MIFDRAHFHVVEMGEGTLPMANEWTAVLMRKARAEYLNEVVVIIQMVVVLIVETSMEVVATVIFYKKSARDGHKKNTALTLIE